MPRRRRTCRRCTVPTLDADSDRPSSPTGSRGRARGPLAEAMTLATVDEAGRPTRAWSCSRAFGPEGFRFFTNLESAKARAARGRRRGGAGPLLARARPPGAGPGPGRAAAERRSRTSTSRPGPASSQLGAWASPQSGRSRSREELDARVDEARASGSPAPRSRARRTGAATCCGRERSSSGRARSAACTTASATRASGATTAGAIERLGARRGVDGSGGSAWRVELARRTRAARRGRRSGARRGCRGAPSAPARRCRAPARAPPRRARAPPPDRGGGRPCALRGRLAPAWRGARSRAPTSPRGDRVAGEAAADVVALGACRIARPWPSLSSPVGEQLEHVVGQVEQPDQVRDRGPAAAEPPRELLLREPELLDQRRAGARLVDRVEVLAGHVLDQRRLQPLGLVLVADDRRAPSRGRPPGPRASGARRRSARSGRRRAGGRSAAGPLRPRRSTRRGVEIDSGSKRVRGWSGLGRISSTGTSR